MPSEGRLIGGNSFGGGIKASILDSVSLRCYETSKWRCQERKWVGSLELRRKT